MEFIKRYNNYSCIYKNDAPELAVVYHYTSSEEAVKSICEGHFWFTDMSDLTPEDKNEGHLALKKLREWMKEEYSEDKLIMEVMEKNIGNDNTINAFISDHKTFVLSLSTNPDSEYMWENYAKGNGYLIVISKNELIKDLSFKLKSGKTRDETQIFKHAPIVYKETLQKEIIEKEFKKLREAKEYGFSDEEKLTYCFKHIMYVGNFYKVEEPYCKEEEYRILVNTFHYDDTELSEYLPEIKLNESNNKQYIEVDFNPEKSIKGIVCQTDGAYQKIQGMVDEKLLSVRSNTKE